MQKVLIIGTVWVEPKSSAAGTRMLQLIHSFLEENYQVHFACVAQKNENSISLESIGVKEHAIELNSSSFDDFIKELNPSFVLFDRFMIEEQFGWRVTENCPNAILILDTEDLHSLRKTRYECLKKEKQFSTRELLNSDLAKREIASILRSDISLIISSYEMQLLMDVFNVPKHILLELPFWIEEIKMDVKLYEERKDFVSIGNFIHAPNMDATLYLKKEIWPLIRKQLLKAKLNIYGAYPTQQALQLHNDKEGFLVHGFAENAQEVIESSRVLLAPLRFGAGLKGKLLEAMQYGTPNVTTEIGVEGMQHENLWSGFIANSPQEFASKAVELYQEKEVWNQFQQNGFEILKRKFLKENHQKKLIDKMNAVQEDLINHRMENFMGSLLQHHTLQSTKYLSKWIEAKNKN